MKNKNLIKQLLDLPMDANVYVGGFAPLTHERNWDGAVEEVHHDRFTTSIFIEFNEDFLDIYTEQERNNEA